MIRRSFAAEVASGQKQVRIVRWSCLAVLGVLVVGLWAQMPYLSVLTAHIVLSGNRHRSVSAAAKALVGGVFAVVVGHL